MEEIWKHYLYNYDISNFGRLRNNKTNHILKPNLVGRGYLGICVSLGSRNKYKMIKIHRAVAETFIPNPNNLPQVNHIDCNKLNNRADNLEWCDNQYNTQHAEDNGLIKHYKREENPSAKLKEEDVRFIREHYIPRHKEYGIRAFSRKYNVHHETIRHALYEETWQNMDD